jgi:hypothetical protein
MVFGSVHLKARISFLVWNYMNTIMNGSIENRSRFDLISHA